MPLCMYQNYIAALDHHIECLQSNNDLTLTITFLVWGLLLEEFPPKDLLLKVFSVKILVFSIMHSYTYILSQDVNHQV